MDALKSLLTGTGGILRVRALLAFAFTFTTCYLFIENGEAPQELLILNAAYLSYYFATRLRRRRRHASCESDIPLVAGPVGLALSVLKSFAPWKNV